jgi:multidrug efflux pump subunit AcrA (membrane-fusion protein)
MGLATSVVEKRNLTREVRTPARIVPDETRLYHVTAKLDGYIEELFVNATGQSVKRGQPLLTIYSPDLVASQQELLTALAASRRLGRSPYPSIAEGGQDLVDAARRRLKLWDIRDSQIARIEATGQVERTLTLYAPSSGHVFEKRVVAGHKTVSGETLLTLADLSAVWAEADIYEPDLPFVKVGMPASMTVSLLSGRPFPGRIAFLNPFLDPRSRTLKARMEIPNPGLLLKPEMYGEVTLSFGLGERLAVPETAVLPKGKKNLVFVETVPGTFTPTEVTLGIRSAGSFEVLSGLDQGDVVVTSANFLVDSESSLRAALQAVAGK